MARIEDIFSTQTVLDYTRARQQPVFLGESLFPERKIQELSFEMIKGANMKQVVAAVHAFDTETQTASRDGISKSAAELALIKRKIRMNEKTIIMLASPRNDAEKQLAMEYVYNDIDNMVNAVRARVEAMRMEALSTGKIIVNENGVNAEVEYGVPTDHQETLSGTSLWTDAGAKPLDDIYDWVDKIVTDTGVTPTRAMTSKSVVNALLKHAAIRKALFGTESDRVATLAQLNALLVSMDLPAIATYDGQYRLQNSNGTYTTKRYFPDNKFVIMPADNLGETIYGLTAEEIELAGKSDIDISAVGNIVTQVYATADPVAHWTKAVATALPSFPAADEVFQAIVKA
jgi:hypothetical protein